MKPVSVFAATAAAGLLLAGCGPLGSSTAQTTPAITSATTAKAAPAASTAAPASNAAAKPAAASPSSSCTLPDNRDVYVWMRSPGVQDSAQQLGEADLANCTTTVDLIMSTAPTGAGYCTQIGWVDQNPGYDVNADVAAPLKHIISEAGPGC